VQERSIGVDEVKQDRIPRCSTERGMMFLKIEWQAESSNALADGTGLGKVAMGKMGEEELMAWRWAICPSKVLEREGRICRVRPSWDWRWRLEVTGTSV
jgi:hypothetical protein